MLVFLHSGKDIESTMRVFMRFSDGREPENVESKVVTLVRGKKMILRDGLEEFLIDVFTDSGCYEDAVDVEVI